MSQNESHLFFLNQSLEIAKLAVKNGNHPFGALLVLDNTVLCTSENEVNSSNDITAHAEIRLIQKAQKTFGLEKLKKCTLYTSTEPCAMCSGAIYWAGIKEVIYGCSTNDLFSIVQDGLFISSREIFNNGTVAIDTKGITETKSFTEIHRTFW